VTFTPAHRGGSGPPLVCLHGFAGTWRMWELVLATLERRHDVLAPTLPGHAGGPPIEGLITGDTLADGVERTLDAAGIGTAHLVGNSLGGHVALQLAARGRARSVVAFAPAGGWDGGGFPPELLGRQRGLLAAAKVIAPHAAAITATPEGRRRATELIVADAEGIPAELIAHLMLAVAACPRGADLLDRAGEIDWTLDAARIDCPVRVVWGTADRLLPWPAAATRLRRDWLPQADWVELEGVGHCPQLDVPLEAAQLVLGATG
jgi:pimeloyl-ACP methyl ester carboxylesterase